MSTIGAGGMGEIYRARDRRLGRDVAIKVALSAAASDPERLARFDQEARAASALNHPNILAIYDTGTYEDAPYVVTELLEGETLSRRLISGRLPRHKAIDYAQQIARGLAAAHARNIVHRDLKPDNLFITTDGHVKILDFGLAKLTSTGSEKSVATQAPTQAFGTMDGVVMGTAGYMAPEQVRGEIVDHRADIFAFGGVLYEMLSGERAFRGATLFETMSAILTQDPPPLADATLDRIVRHCLEKRPEDRFQSTRDLLFDLEALDAPGTAAMLRGRRAPLTRRTIGRTAALALLLATAAAAFAIGHYTVRPLSPSFTQLTFRRGSLSSARFSPDGSTVIYSAAWNGNTADLYTTRTDSQESRPLGMPNADVLAVSATGELAVLLNRRPVGAQFTHLGTLARVPLAGGSPRALLDDVQAADWAPDGQKLAVVRAVGGRNRLEFPIGTTLYDTAGWVSAPRISPDGRLIAFLDHQAQWDDRGWVSAVDLAGRKTTLSGEWSVEEGLAWSPDGREVWFSAARAGGALELHAVTREGRERIVTRSPAAVMLQDIARDGRVLSSVFQFSSDVIGLGPEDTKERNLSWLDDVRVRDIAADGSSFVFSHFGAGSGANYSVYIRRTDGSPPVRLGDGAAWALSPDQRWVLAILSSPPAIALLPTGAGEVRRLPRNGIEAYGLGASWHPDGVHILFNGRVAGQTMRTYLQSVTDGTLQPIMPEGVTGTLISPDGRLVVAQDQQNRRRIYPLGGGEPRTIRGLDDAHDVIRWTADGRGLFVASKYELPVKIERLDVSSGEMTLVKELQPADPAGVVGPIPALLSADGRWFIYGLTRALTSLFVISGLS